MPLNTLTGELYWKRASSEGATHYVSGMANASAGFILAYSGAIAAGSPIHLSNQETKTQSDVLVGGAWTLAALPVTYDDITLVMASILADDTGMSGWTAGSTAMTERADGGTPTAYGVGIGAADLYQALQGSTGAFAVTLDGPKAEAVLFSVALIAEPVLPSLTTAQNYLRWVRQAPHITNEDVWIFYHEFRLEMAVGVGLATGQGSEPAVALQWSDDGGHTWSQEYWVTGSEIGQYEWDAVWRRLGRSRDRIFRVIGSDPVTVQLVDAFLSLSQGLH